MAFSHKAVTLPNTTGPERLRGNARAIEALAMRRAGIPYVEIAEKLGYADHTGPLKAVQRALKTTIQEPADDVRDLELDRLEAMWRKTWEWVMNNDPRAIDRALRLMERRSKYLGLDAPKQIDLRLIRNRAQEIADRLGVPVGDVLARAVLVAEEAGAIDL